jgi:hypothetical protein
MLALVLYLGLASAARQANVCHIGVACDRSPASDGWLKPPDCRGARAGCRGWAVEQSSMSANSGGHVSRLFDGRNDTFWRIGNYQNQWAVLDMGGHASLSRARVAMRPGSASRITKLAFYRSTSPRGPWDLVTSQSVPSQCSEFLVCFPTATGRYWKLAVVSTEGGNPELAHLSLYGRFTASKVPSTVQTTIKRCPCVYQANSLYSGAELKGSLRVETREECCGACISNKQCQDWVFCKNPRNPAFGWCSLRARESAEPAVALPHADFDSGSLCSVSERSSYKEGTLQPETAAPTQCSAFVDGTMNIEGDYPVKHLTLVTPILARLFGVETFEVELHHITILAEALEFQFTVTTSCGEQATRVNIKANALKANAARFEQLLHLDAMARGIRLTMHVSVTSTINMGESFHARKYSVHPERNAGSIRSQSTVLRQGISAWKVIAILAIAAIALWAVQDPTTSVPSSRGLEVGMHSMQFTR